MKRNFCFLVPLYPVTMMSFTPTPNKSRNAMLRLFGEEKKKRCTFDVLLPIQVHQNLTHPILSFHLAVILKEQNVTAVLEQEIIKKKTDHRVPSLNSFICTKQYTSKKKNYQNPWEKKLKILYKNM